MIITAKEGNHISQYRYTLLILTTPAKRLENV